MNVQSHWLNDTLQWLLNASDGDFDAHQLPSLSIDAHHIEEIELLIDQLLSHWESASKNPLRLRLLMQWIANRLLTTQQSSQQSRDTVAVWVSPELLERLYDALVETDATACAHVLQCLAAQKDTDSLSVLAAILRDKPPSDWQPVAIGLSPLWNSSASRLEEFFSQMNRWETQVSTWPVLLDLANHAIRSRRLSDHPMRGRELELRRLLSDVVIRLEKLERDPAQFGSQVKDVQKVLSEGISLAISLCDALGLIGNVAAVQSLSQAMELSHRRVQVEAAAALIRLGDPRGEQRLVALAADPVARLRAVQYAEELDILDAIGQEHRYPLALAESELVSWLASPENFGVPPSSIQNIDCRTLYWPGYDEPRDCALFQFRYQLPAGDYSNIGISGPMTHAFSLSLEGLEVDDVYAAFAGWHAEHEELFEVPAQQLNVAQQAEARRLERAFQEEGFLVESIIALAFLLGEPSLLARLNRDGQACVGVTNGIQVTYFRKGESDLANSPEMVLAVYRGRRLLSAFND